MKFDFFNKTKRLIQSVLVLSLSFLVFSGCGKQTNDEVTYQVKPEVSYKFSEDEVTDFQNRRNRNQTLQYENLTIRQKPILSKPDNLPQSLFYDSGIHIDYPEEGVKGIYVTIDNMKDPELWNYLLDYIDQTALNSIVIDFKDDNGVITGEYDSSHPWTAENMVDEVGMREVLKELERRDIYPIARIVTFKDARLAVSHPELSFESISTGELWQDGNGAMFVNPFMKEVWDYNIDVAIGAAKLGFKEVQFDYIRFPEGFESIDSELNYEIGDYDKYLSDNPDDFGRERVQAINDFLDYAQVELAPYGVKIGADVFGYTAIGGDLPDVRGIGQNFAQMADRVDVISSMIYPSHWGFGFFGYDYPDMHPFEIVDEYMLSEEQVLRNVKQSTTSRPWLQDFTYSYEYGYQEYSAPEVQAQINALANHGVYEYLLWNVNGDYSVGVDYAPEITGSQYE